MLLLPPKNWRTINWGLPEAGATTNFYRVKEAFAFFYG